MQFQRIFAILTQEYFIIRGALEVIFDLIVYPIFSTIIFGFISLYLAQSASKEVAFSILYGMIFWQILYTVQYSVSLGSLWNIWSRNLSNLFVAPLQLNEYIFAHTLSGILKALLVVTFCSLMSFFVFHFNLLQVSLPVLVLSFINLVLFAFSFGLIVLGLIFRFGTRIQGLAWGLLPIFQPLTAAFYPVNIMPAPLQVVAYMLSPTYIFETGRYYVTTHATRWDYLGIAFLLNTLYVVFAIVIFQFMFATSKVTGQFARNES
ncbi:ABC transporter permease [Candidatus Roizmanbacteria bacterium]|nr:ABC transporter permease [Candidatus Roizmanbacteria bacterium]